MIQLFHDKKLNHKFFQIIFLHRLFFNYFCNFNFPVIIGLNFSNNSKPTFSYYIFDNCVFLKIIFLFYFDKRIPFYFYLFRWIDGCIWLFLWGFNFILTYLSLRKLFCWARQLVIFKKDGLNVLEIGLEWHVW